MQLSLDEAEDLPRGSRGSAAIAAKLRRAILAGAYSYRERLPAERDLAQHFSASRSTVREALRQLEESQLVVRRVGSGTFVNFRHQTPEADIAERTSPLELVQVRIAVEPQIVRLAIMHATQRDLDRLSEALRAVQSANVDREVFTRADARFHFALAECTRNPLLIWLYQQINDVRNHAQWRSVKDKVLTPARQREYNEQHYRLFEAIRSRDVESAVALITRHQTEAQRDLIGANR